MQIHMAGGAEKRALAAQKAEDAAAKEQEKEDYRQNAMKELKQEHTTSALQELGRKENAEEKIAAAGCAKRTEIQTTGAAKTSLEETQKAVTAEQLQTRETALRTTVTDELNAEMNTKVQNSGNPQGSPEYNAMLEELQSGLAADIDKVMQPRKTELIAELQKTADDAVNAKLAATASTMKAACEAAAAERAKGYGQLTADQLQTIESKVESDLPERMEDFGKDEAPSESQNKAPPGAELGAEQAYVNTARLKDSVYSSHVQLLDDGDVYYNLLR